VEPQDQSGKVFCGTETAAYAREANGTSWVDITANHAPVTVYWSAEALYPENTIRFGTYGRGIWDYDNGRIPRTKQGTQRPSAPPAAPLSPASDELDKPHVRPNGG
jgi:hypothetical protein